MINLLFRKIILLTSLFIINQTTYANDDSTGIGLKNELQCILHQVDAGQGLFGIAKRYGIPIKEISAFNPGVDKNMVPGQIVYIPIAKTSYINRTNAKYLISGNESFKIPDPINTKTEDPIKTEKRVKKQIPQPTNTEIYIIKKGESLIKIGKEQNLSLETIKSLNQLESDEIFEGDTLYLPIKSNNEELNKKEDQVKKLEAELELLKQKLEQQSKKNIDTIVRTNNKEPLPETKKNSPSKGYEIKVENVPEFGVEKVTEIGNIKISNDGLLNENKSIALHHFAQIGTIIKIEIPDKNKYLYLRVVGNFKKENSDNTAIIISKFAANQIGIDKNTEQVVLSFAK